MFRIPKTFPLIALTCLSLSACQPNTPQVWAGYVEGEYLYISAPIGGRIDKLGVSAGQNVEMNALLFQLDKEAEEASRDESAARLQVAKAQAENTSKGRRKDELAVTEAQLANAQAQATLASNELQRQQQLVAQGFISKAKLEDALTNAKLTQARLKEIQAALQVAKLPARVDEQKAAQANTDAAQQAFRQANWRAAQKSQVAPLAGQITEVFFRPGEVVAAGQPILSLLPPANIKLRFFVPESELAKIQLGQVVQVGCDQCDPSLQARITRISSQAEYTPPIIYSNSQRAKLVFMVEAKPISTVTKLHPGQPVDIKPIKTTAEKSS
jgi:HlyD family secretion protein